MCGKDMQEFLHGLPFRGSPPHVRERHKLHTKNAETLGITPACAGKTW